MADSRDSQAPLVPQSVQPESAEEAIGTEERTRKRDFFRFGKKEDDKKKTKAAASTTSYPANISPAGLRPVSPLAGLEAGRSPNSPYGTAASPRGIGSGMRSASPRTHSPASSMIFERSVQEDVDAIPQASPQIPSHIITENHIPPALDATSEAITDKKLDPDTVEIVTHAAHQPAAVTITEGTHHDTTQPNSPVLSEQNIQITSPVPMAIPSDSQLAEHPTTSTTSVSASASNYANLDSTDIRRLSFISFADVVHGEHDFPGSSDSRRESGAPSLPVPLPRSPSPMRSPVAGSPPTSEASPHRAPTLGLSEVNIETMRQALRKTGSGDLSGYRSVPVSAVGNDEGLGERSFR